MLTAASMPIDAVGRTKAAKNRSLISRFLGAAVAIFLILAAASGARAQSLSLVTSQAALQSNDNISWAQLGSDNGATLASSFNATSANQNPVTVTLSGSNSILAVSCPASSCSWAGAGMPSADALIWTSDGNNGGNGPLTVSFGHPQAGVGAFIQADGPSQFTAQIQAFNSAEHPWAPSVKPAMRLAMPCSSAFWIMPARRFPPSFLA